MTPQAGASTAYDAEDGLRHVAALADRYVRALVWARDNLHRVAPDARFEDLAISGAQDILHTVRGHLAVHGGVGGDRYSTGMPVTSRIELRAGEQWEWCWHPCPSDEHNRPRVIEPATLPDGRRGAVIVAAPGVLDLVPEQADDGGGV